MRIWVVVRAVLGVAILAAGCGSSQEGTDRAEFIEKADRICAEGNRKIHQSISPSVKGDIGLPMSIGSATAVKKGIVPDLADELRRFRSIAPPAAAAAYVDGLLQFLRAIRLIIDT